MLNENLIGKKDAEIARLKIAIEKFKEYDNNRKEYYKTKLQKLGELEALLDEIDSSKDKLKQKIITQRKEIKHLSDIIRVSKIEENRTPEELAEIVTFDSIKVENKKLRAENKKLKEDISRLISTNVQLTKQLESW